MAGREKLGLGLVYGSTRVGRFCDTVAEWAAGQVLARGDFELDRIDPARLALSPRHELEDGVELLALRERMDRLDAFLLVVPEYNHAYPAALKFLLESTFGQWQAKPVGVVSYGGFSGGLRAVEQLRPVLADLHAVVLRDAVCFVNAWQQFDRNGRLLRPQPAMHSMALLLARLHWWAGALHEARAAYPYQEVAA